MSVCPNCGAANNDYSKFCTSCGGPLPVAQSVQQPVQQQVQQPAQSVPIQSAQNQYWQQQPQQQAVPVQPVQAVPIVPTQPVYATPITQPVQNRPKNNGMCQAGFVLSIIGIFTMGITCPLGFLFSLIGIFSASKKKQPGKGKAIAGLIISGIIILSLATCIGIAWNDIKRDFEAGNISSIDDIFSDIDDASERYDGTYNNKVKKVTDEKWIETNSGSYLTFGKKNSFKYYMTYEDTSDNYYTGTYRLYFGEDAIKQITNKYKEYGVTKSEIDDLIKNNSVITRDNIVFLVLENDGQWMGGKNVKDEKWESPYYGFFVSSPNKELALVNMNAATYFTFVPEDDYEKLTTATRSTTAATVDETTEETTAETLDPSVETFGDSKTGTIALTQGSWGSWTDASYSNGQFESAYGRINLKTATIINNCVYKQDYNGSAVKTLADGLKKNLKDSNGNAELKTTTLGGYGAYEISSKYSDGTTLVVWLMLDNNNKLHYITVEYKDNDVASYDMVKSTYKFN